MPRHYNFVNDAKLEGACILLDQMGYQIDRQFSKEKGEKYHEFFYSFRKLETRQNAPISLRVKLLIRNMFDNRSSGWKKTKDLFLNTPKKLQYRKITGLDQKI